MSNTTKTAEQFRKKAIEKGCTPEEAEAFVKFCLRDAAQERIADITDRMEGTARKIGSKPTRGQRNELLRKGRQLVNTQQFLKAMENR